jgi:hypothetical protein
LTLVEQPAAIRIRVNLRRPMAAAMCSAVSPFLLVQRIILFKKNKEKKGGNPLKTKNYKNKREAFVVVVVVVVTLFCSETLHWALTRMRITPA